MVLFTYKEIPIEGKPVLIKEWFDSNIWSKMPGKTRQN